LQEVEEGTYEKIKIKSVSTLIAVTMTAVTPTPNEGVGRVATGG
jgi:hypothetical protein